MRLITTNYIQESQTTITASSSNVNYPASNIAHYFRSKTWRSNAAGTFIINSTNNKIDFKESSIGSELHATITTGTYSATTLATEIKTRMQSAGTATYTVTYSGTTGKWTISTSGSYLSLLNLTGVNQTTSTLKLALGFANSDRTGSLTYTGSNIAIHTEESIVFDLQTIEDIDSVVLLWPKEDGIRLSSTAVIKIQANATNTWSSPAVNQTLTIDNTYSMFSNYFTTAQSYRYWRVSIVDPTNPNLWVDLGVVVLGKGESIQTADNGFSYSLTDMSIITTTSFGNDYVDEYPQIANLSLSLSNLDYTDTQILDNVYRTNGTRKPVFITLDENSNVYSKNHFAIYGKMQPNLNIGHVNYDIFNTSLIIKEAL